MPQDPHLTQPGTARITIHALDEETAVAVGFALAERSNVTGPSAPYRIPGEDGVCVRMYGSTSPTYEMERHPPRAPGRPGFGSTAARSALRAWTQWRARRFR
ncbi:DUF6207 family protein [Streptomyces mirabilis]